MSTLGKRIKGNENSLGSAIRRDGPTKDFVRVRSDLLTYWTRAINAAQQAHGSVDRAGVPRVMHGAKVRQALLRVTSGLTSTFSVSKVRTAKLDTKNESRFKAQLQSLLHRADVATSHLDIGKPFHSLGTRRLDAAVRRDPGCRTLRK